MSHGSTSRPMLRHLCAESGTSSLDVSGATTELEQNRAQSPDFLHSR